MKTYKYICKRYIDTPNGTGTWQVLGTVLAESLDEAWNIASLTWNNVHSVYIF